MLQSSYSMPSTSYSAPLSPAQKLSQRTCGSSSDGGHGEGGFPEVGRLAEGECPRSAPAR